MMCRFPRRSAALRRRRSWTPRPDKLEVRRALSHFLPADGTILVATTRVVDKHAPTGIVVDAAGGGAPGLGNVVSINPNTGGQTLISTGGLLANTNGDSVDTSGDIFVSTFATARPSTQARILEINPSTGARSTVATGGSLDFASGEVIFSRPAL